MLVLSRKEGQSIEVGDDIRIVVTSIQGSRVRIAIEAPRHLGIRRSELLASSVGSLASKLGAAACLDGQVAMLQ